MDEHHLRETKAQNPAYGLPCLFKEYMSHHEGVKMLKKIMLTLIVLGVIGYVALSARPPKEFILQTKLIDEASGLAHGISNPALLWTHNDSGGKAQLYALDHQANLCAILNLEGIKNRDWEDIASWKDPKNGKAYLFVGEIGDNNAKYGSVFVYKVEEPRVNEGDSIYTAKTVESFEINYEDGARDAEALFIDPASADIYIVSKREDQVGLYRVTSPQSAQPNIAHKVCTLPLSWVTAADISSNGKKLLVKTYPGVWQFKLSRSKDGGLTVTKKPKSLPYITEPQGEGLCFDAKAKAYYTLSEAGESGEQVLYFYK